MKDGSCCDVNDINPNKCYPGHIPRNPGQCKYDAYSLSCKQGLNLMINIYDYVALYN